MANIYEIASLYIRPYYGKIVFLLILGIFLWSAYYGYNKWANKPKPYDDIYKPENVWDVKSGDFKISLDPRGEIDDRV